MKERVDISEKQTPERLVYEFFNRVWSPPHELNAIDELIIEDHCITTAGAVVKGRIEFKKWIGSFHKLLPEARNEIIDIFYNEAQNKVVSRWICSGKKTDSSDYLQRVSLFLFRALLSGRLKMAGFPNVGLKEVPMNFTKVCCLKMRKNLFDR